MLRLKRLTGPGGLEMKFQYDDGSGMLKQVERVPSQPIPDSAGNWYEKYDYLPVPNAPKADPRLQFVWNAKSEKTEYQYKEKNGFRFGELEPFYPRLKATSDDEVMRSSGQEELGRRWSRRCFCPGAWPR